MKQRVIGDLKVSEIGMGCMGFSHGYGTVPDEKYSIEAIQKAFAAGCTFYDTAEAYGKDQFWQGHNEQLVGKAVKDFRGQIVLATKFHFGDYVYDNDEHLYDVVRSHLEASLKNLKTDYIDLYYLHRLNKNVPVEKIAEVMGKLIYEGLIRAWGLSQVDTETVRKANDVTHLSAVQNLYNMMERDCEETLIPFCLEHNIGLVPFSPIASGFLSGKVTTATDFSHSDDVRKYVPQLSKENIAANQPLLDLLAEYATVKNATNAQISLAWMLKKYPNIVPIPGSKNQGRILENLGASEIKLDDFEFKKLDATLNSIEIHGHRGIVEYDGSSMASWITKK